MRKVLFKILWSYIKSQRKDHCGVAPLKVDGAVCNNSSDKAEILNNYFTSVFTPISLDTPPPMDEPLIPDIDPIQVEPNGIVELLKSLEVHKAAELDEIPAQLLKETSKLLAPHSLLFIKHHYNTTPYQEIGKKHTLYPFSRRATMLLLVTTDLYPNLYMF